MILEIYRDSIPYSIKEKAILIKLGIITILGFLIVPIVFLFGYSYRIIQIGLNGVLLENEDPLASFGNLKLMFIQGLKMIFVLFVYSFLSIIVSILAIFRFNLVEFTHFFSSFKIDFQLDFGLGLIVLLFVVWFITFTFASTAISHMINRGSLNTAFKFTEILTIIKHVQVFEYFKFFISFIVLSFSFFIVGILATELIFNILNILALNLFNFTFKGSYSVFLTLDIFFIINSFILIPIFLIVESRANSFIYNDDALIEEDSY